jgi:hypothetical protein
MTGVRPEKKGALPLGTWSVRGRPTPPGRGLYNRLRGAAGIGMYPLRGVALLVVLFAARAWAEPAGAVVSGTVFDSSGAVIPGANVLLKKDDGISVASSVADGQGAFSFETLPSGRYVVEVQRPGFKTFTSHITVGARPRSPLKVTLEVASIAEEVTVGNEGLSTHPGENRDAVVVDQKLLKDLPVFDQDYISTLSAFLDQGAVGSDGVSLVVDGAEANRVPVSPSAIQEVRINQNPYSSEYFRPGRGRIEIITKQAAPEYHGTLNVLFRDSTLNARDAFAPTKAPEQRRIYEGELSGPVGRLKDTTFLISLDRQEEDIQSIVLAAGPQGEIRQNVPTPQRHTEFSARLTRQLGPKHTLWAEYALEDRGATNQGAGGFTLPEAASNAAYHEDDLDVSDQIVGSGNLVNQFFVHFEWNHGSTTSVSPAPRLVVQDAFTTGGAQADQRQTEGDFKLFDNVSWTRGKHLLKAGFQAAEWSHRTYDDLTNRGGTFLFSSLADYELGRPYAFTEQIGNGYVPLFQKILGGYVQDEFQLRPNLSVALGTRYDYQNLLRDGRLAPRLFAAFAPGKNPKLMLRGGVGFFSDRFPPNAFGNFLQHDGRHLSSYLLLNPSYPNPTASLSGQPTNIVQFAPAIRTPYTIQYSVGAEWQVAKGTSVAATYRGSRGVSWLRSVDVNAPMPPLYASRPNPAQGQVRQIESAGRQAGDALEFSFRGKVGKIFSGLAQYTLSRSRNNTSGVNFFPANSYDPQAEWGPADFDQRHRVNILGSFDFRFLKLGVGLSAASGKPYTLTTGLDANHDGLLNDRPSGVGRNSLRGPGYADIDLTISRDIRFDKAKGEKGPTATLGVGLYNALNAFSPSTIEGDENSPFFGQAIAALPPRRLQLTARFGF